MGNHIIRLKKLSLTCDFADETADDMIRDQIIENCRSQVLRKKLLCEQDLTLHKIQTTAMANDSADMQSSKMQDNTHTEAFPREVTCVNSINRNSAMSIINQSLLNLRQRKNIICYCGGKKGHIGCECIRSKDNVCHNCKARGQFAKMCRTI